MDFHKKLWNGLRNGPQEVHSRISCGTRTPRSVISSPMACHALQPYAMPKKSHEMEMEPIIMCSPQLQCKVLSFSYGVFNTNIRRLCFWPGNQESSQCKITETFCCQIWMKSSILRQHCSAAALDGNWLTKEEAQKLK